MSASRPDRAVYLVTGAQMTENSTVARALADRLPRSVRVRGDLLRRMLVDHRAGTAPNPGEEPVRQLRVRHQLTATVVDGYFGAGFMVVAQDVALGAELSDLVRAIRSRPLHVLVVAPCPVAAARDAEPAPPSYGGWTAHHLDRVPLEETPDLGLWIDPSERTPTETAEEILSRVPPPPRA